MSVLALALYGSYARGDQTYDSDIDLFAITDGNSYESSSNGKANISCYPLEIVMERCREGDIYFLHIAKESKPIFDPENLLEKINSTFQYKDDYSSEIKNAADIAWTLIQHKELFADYKKYNARLAWCLRTMIISRAAESRLAIFSSAELGEFSKNPLVETAIKNRNLEDINEVLINATRDILLEYDMAPPKINNHPMPLLFYFMRTKNKFGRKIIIEHCFEGSIEKDDYE